MAKQQTIQTERLILRRWTADDLAPFAAMNADPRVMEYFPECLTREESDGMAARIEARFDELGFGLWAVEIPNVVGFAGYVGLTVPRFESHFTPCIEMGWRLASEHWGHGYATEAARAAVTFGFERLELKEIVAFTVPANVRSRRVMEKIGMTRNPADDFDHPRVPEGHLLRHHVLYRIRNARV